MKEKSEFNRFDFGGLFGGIGGLLAAMVGLSFIFGYISHSEFLKVLGLGWYAAALDTEFYAVKAILPFSLIAPSVIFSFALLKHLNKKINPRLLVWGCLVVMFAVGVYGQWLFSRGFQKEEKDVVELAVSIGRCAPLLVGVGFGVSVYLLRFEEKLKYTAFMMMILSLYLGLLVIPSLQGTASALLMRGGGIYKLPYVLIDDERWAILHYVKGNSLLLKFDGGFSREYKFVPIEQLLIKRDEKFRFPYSKFVQSDKKSQ